MTCTSRDTSKHVNPMLEIDNGAVSIPDSYIRNDWPSSTTLNAPRGLAESGLQGYYTCRTEGDTFLSPHLLHSSNNYSTYRALYFYSTHYTYARAHSWLSAAYYLTESVNIIKRTVYFRRFNLLLFPLESLSCCMCFAFFLFRFS